VLGKRAAVPAARRGVGRSGVGIPACASVVGRITWEHADHCEAQRHCKWGVGRNWKQQEES